LRLRPVIVLISRIRTSSELEALLLRRVEPIPNFSQTTLGIQFVEAAVVRTEVAILHADVVPAEVDDLIAARV
jgi:hypothetical protein